MQTSQRQMGFPGLRPVCSIPDILRYVVSATLLAIFLAFFVHVLCSSYLQKEAAAISDHLETNI